MVSPKSLASTFFRGIYWTWVGPARASAAVFAALDETVDDALDSTPPLADVVGTPDGAVLVDAEALARFLLLAFGFETFDFGNDGAGMS